MEEKRELELDGNEAVELDERIKIALEQQRAEYEERIAKLKLDFEVEVSLLKAGAKNVTAAAALIDRDTLGVGKAGELLGLDEQIKALKESDETSFLFKDEQKRVINGFTPYDGVDMPYDGEGMTYSQFCEIYAK